MPNLGPLEWGIILVIIIIFFGVGRLPEVGSALGKAIREFRRTSQGIEEQEKKEEEEKKEGTP